jgi:uncharacterized protein
MMKLLAISDEIVDWIYSPSLAQRCPDVDLVISCGDLPIHYLEYVTSSLNVPCYFVRGNHDLHQISDNGEIRTEPQGWINLDLQRTRFRNLTLAGLEGCIRYKPVVPAQYTQQEQWLRTYWLARKMIFGRLRRGVGVDIMVTHAPAYGVNDGPDFAHTGFHAYNWLITHFRPRLFIHGHQHRNYSPLMPGDSRINETRIINAHPYRLLEV